MGCRETHYDFAGAFQFIHAECLIPAFFTAATMPVIDEAQLPELRWQAAAVTETPL